jgi:3-hydroxybutyryl-CoA dehydrogenase
VKCDVTTIGVRVVFLLRAQETVRRGGLLRFGSMVLWEVRVSPDGVERIGVVGAGTMGSQIAQQCALYGYQVVLVDSEPEQLERAAVSNRGHLQRRVEKGKLGRDEMETALGRVQQSTSVGSLAETDFVIEAIVEDVHAKRDLFQLLDRTVAGDTVLASNSSTIGISQIAGGSVHPDRCVNMHFFHPVLVMRLVEVMRGPATSDETVSRAVALAAAIDKEAVVINREVYGLLVNRILGAIKREAFWLAAEGYATPEDIDRAVQLGLNHPMGPFELTDFSGIDVFYYAALQRYRETGDVRDRPPEILEEKVRAGHLGRKTGRGFYEYGDSKP